LAIFLSEEVDHNPFLVSFLTLEKSQHYNFYSWFGRRIPCISYNKTQTNDHAKKQINPAPATRSKLITWTLSIKLQRQYVKEPRRRRKEKKQWDHTILPWKKPQAIVIGCREETIRWHVEPIRTVTDKRIVCSSVATNSITSLALRTRDWIFIIHVELIFECYPIVPVFGVSFLAIEAVKSRIWSTLELL
jgi:hypothetical protein